MTNNDDVRAAAEGVCHSCRDKQDYIRQLRRITDRCAKIIGDDKASGFPPEDVVMFTIHDIKERNAKLVEALKAADSIMWMAKEYAEAGGRHGPEQRDYDEVMPVIQAALAANAK